MKIKHILIVLSLLINPWTSVFAAQDAYNQFVLPEYSQTISMDFKEAPLADVLKILSQQTGMNYITEGDIATKTVTLYLDKVPVEVALVEILETNDLMYEIKPDTNIFVVKAKPKQADPVITRIYRLRYASVASSKINSTISITSSSGSSSSDSSSSSSESSASSSTSGSSSTTSSASVSTGIGSALSALLTASGKIVEDPRTNSLVITDVKSNFASIEQTLQKLDVPIPQIMIQVEMLEVSKLATEKMGIEYGDTPLAFKGATRNMYYPFNQNRILQNNELGFNQNGIPSTIEGSDQYSVGSLSASGMTAALKFLKSQTDTRSLARPRLLTMNNETAQIKISTNEAIGVTKTEATDTTGATYEAERVETGVFLTVTPQANLATNKILMAVYPRVIQASLSKFKVSGQDIKDPEERGSQSILEVNNGETIIIGGLLRRDKAHTVNKLPFLGDIPVLGAAFRNKDNSDIDRELIIFITPYILDNKYTPELKQETRDKIKDSGMFDNKMDDVKNALNSIEGKT